MKNVQVIDGAENTVYRIYQFTDEQFTAIFPGAGQNIEFIEDVRQRLSKSELRKAFDGVWKRIVRKSEVQGIDGTLFYELDFKRKYYPNKAESDMDRYP